jgi:hypothetical protein
MVKLQNTSEAVPLIISVVWFAFVAVNVNQLLGLIYLSVFTIGSMIIFKWDRIRTTPFNRTNKWFMPAIQAVFIYVGFVLIASLFLPLFEKLNVGQLIQLIATTTPALAGSQILNTITFVIFVPFVETIFFVILLDYFATKTNVDITRRGLFQVGTWALVIGLSFIFLLFHLTAKGVTNNVALLLVFLMMMVTLGVTIWFGESKQAVFFHCYANMFGLGLLASLTGVIV